jgi:hypothetical protein
VWKLALAGSELALLANLSPFAQTRVSATKGGMLACRCLMVLTGMTAYALPTPSARLVAVSIATWTGWLAMTSGWHRLRGSSEMLVEGRGRPIVMLSTDSSLRACNINHDVAEVHQLLDKPSMVYRLWSSEPPWFVSSHTCSGRIRLSPR